MITRTPFFAFLVGFVSAICFLLIPSSTGLGPGRGVIKITIYVLINIFACYLIARSETGRIQFSPKTLLSFGAGFLLGFWLFVL